MVTDCLREVGDDFDPFVVYRLSWGDARKDSKHRILDEVFAKSESPLQNLVV